MAEEETFAAPLSWDLPWTRPQVQRILESACNWGASSLTLVDGEGNVCMEVNSASGVATENLARVSTEAETSAPVLAGGSTIARIRAVAPAGVPLDQIAQAAAARLADAWDSAQEIEDLAGEIVHAYEELHLLYELGDSLTGHISVAAAADVILESVLEALHASWAELHFTDVEEPVYVRPGRLAGQNGVQRSSGDHRLATTLRSGGLTVGSIVLVRPREGQPFSSHDSKLLDAVGTLVGNAIHNAQLYEALRQQAEALRESEAYLRTVLDNVADGILTFNEQGFVESFNPTAERIFGYSSGEINGQHFKKLLSEPCGREYESGLNHYLETGQGRVVGSGTQEAVGQHKNGMSFPMEMAVSEMRLGSQRQFIVSLRDITGRKQTEEAMSRAERLRALGQLAGGIAHNLNQSLALIAGYSELVLHGLGDTTPNLPTLRDSLALVTKAAMDGGDTVKRLLLFARTQPEGEQERVDLSALLNEVAQLTAPRWRDAARAEGRAIKLEVVTEGQTTIEGWPASLRQAFTNLVLNAVDAMPSGGTIRLSSERQGAVIRIRVSDTGCGMSPEVQARLFEPFFTTKGVKGMGLGLSMVFGIIERHGGTITVSSTVDVGTTFELSFPASVPAISPIPLRRVDSTKSGPLSILAVDDEPAIAQMVAQMLRPEGHTVVTANSGEEAVERLEHDSFDLVISDLGMGNGMDGWQLAEQVQQRWPDIRFMLATGWGVQIDPIEAGAKGVEAVICKPYRLAEMRRLVSQVAATRHEAAVCGNGQS